MHTNRLTIGVAALLLISLAPIEGTQLGPDREFFIDSYTGTPNCIIVVGDRAAVSDIIAASWIATQIGAMAYINESISVITQQEVVLAENEGLPNSKSKENDGITGILDYQSSTQGPESHVVLPHTHTDDPLWDYDVYLDAFSTFEGNWLIDTMDSYESFSIDFSIWDANGGQLFCDICSAAKWQSANSAEALTLNQTYPALFPRHYWGTIDAETVFDPVGGVAYRSTVYHMPTQPETTYNGWTITLGEPGPAQYATVTTPIPLPANVAFLGNHYDILEFGTNSEGYDYALYGTPVSGRVDTVAKEPVESVPGIDIRVDSIDVYHGTVTFAVSSPSLPPQSITICKDETIFICDEITPGIERPVQCITLSALSIRSERTASLETIRLEEYGALTEHIFGIDGPYVICNGIEWYLDIMPADEVQSYDKDNDEALYADGNPSYNASDNLTIYESNETMPYFEVWMATPMEIVGVLDENLMGCLTNEYGEEILSFEITDTNHKDLIVDSVKIFQKKSVISNSKRCYINVDTSMLAVTDGQMGPEEKSDYNLILIGGPIANDIVGELLALGITTIGTWTESEGEYIHYNDVFVTGKDVLVVAGKDREATTAAARMLLDMMSNL